MTVDGACAVLFNDIAFNFLLVVIFFGGIGVGYVIRTIMKG